MKIDIVNNTSFGLRKLTTLQDLAKQRRGKITPEVSTKAKDYAEYMRKVVLNAKTNAINAIESAKNIFIR